MLYAHNKLGEKIPAIREKEITLGSTCPGCGAKVIPKCGEINIWHWAHEANSNCTYSTGETEWHLRWKSCFYPENVEVTVGKHRADVFIFDRIIEFQNSDISIDDIRSRESNYPNLIWVINGEKFRDRFHFNYKGDYVTYTWLYRKKPIQYMNKPVFIDFGDNSVFLIRRSHGKNGWGDLMTIDGFFRDHILRGNPPLMIKHYLEY